MSVRHASLGGMRETPEELAALQRLMDDSFARGSRHLAAIMTPPRRLSAERLVADLPSPAVLNIATVTARGEPRISAVDGHFISRPLVLHHRRQLTEGAAAARPHRR